MQYLHAKKFEKLFLNLCSPTWCFKWLVCLLGLFVWFVWFVCLFGLFVWFSCSV